MNLKLKNIGKNAKIITYYNWVELLTFAVMLFGIILSFVGDSAFVNYIIISLSGFLIGRLKYVKKKSITFPFYITTIGYLIGFIIGAEFRDRGNFIIIIILYILFIYFGHYAYKRKWFRF